MQPAAVEAAVARICKAGSLLGTEESVVHGPTAAPVFVHTIKVWKEKRAPMEFEGVAARRADARNAAMRTALIRLSVLTPLKKLGYAGIKLECPVVGFEPLPFGWLYPGAIASAAFGAHDEKMAPTIVAIGCKAGVWITDVVTAKPHLSDESIQYVVFGDENCKFVSKAFHLKHHFEAIAPRPFLCENWTLLDLATFHRARATKTKPVEYVKEARPSSCWSDALTHDAKELATDAHVMHRVAVQYLADKM
jgi:hypothetical protein